MREKKRKEEIFLSSIEMTRREKENI